MVEAGASRVPAIEKAMDSTPRVWLSSVCSGSPILASQSCTVWSQEAEASHVPSVEKATDKICSIASMTSPISRLCSHLSCFSVSLAQLLEQHVVG